MCLLWQGKLDLPCQIAVKERCASLGMLLYQNCRRNTGQKDLEDPQILPGMTAGGGSKVNLT